MLLALAGLALLLVGGDILVRGSVAIALRLRLSPMLIGATLVGFGTSMPEMLTSVEAALAGAPGIAFGNVIGSNIANILLILGVAALISPITAPAGALRGDGAAMGVAALACAAAVLWGGIDRWIGAAFLLALGVYVWRAMSGGREETEEARALAAASGPWGVHAAMAAGGLIALMVGASWLVEGAIALAAALGVSDAVIGLTVVAVGTSLPELAASVAAAAKGRADLALGNVLGSNVFNVFAILGVTALVQPMAAPAQMAAFDIWAMLGASALLLALVALRGRIGRGAGAGMAAIYAGYVGWLALGAG